MHKKYKSHQHSGLRWFRFKTLPTFQLGGFTLPPTPFPGLCFEGAAVPQVHFIRCSFRAPFFHHLVPPKIVITSYSGFKTAEFWGPKRGPKQAPTSGLAFSVFFVGFLIFRHLHQK